MPYINKIIKNTSVLGPGNRIVIWFQGCNKSCSGCLNIEGQKINAGEFYSNDKLLEIIKSIDNIIGVTISGGEPFLQADELCELVSLIKINTNLDIMLYSGYKFEELYKKYTSNFFENIDIFIDGEYIEELNDDSMYRGSSNQNIYCFTPKYKQFLSKILKTKNRSVEFEFDEENELFFVGIPPKNFFYKLLEKKNI